MENLWINLNKSHLPINSAGSLWTSSSLSKSIRVELKPSLAASSSINNLYTVRSSFSVSCVIAMATSLTFFLVSASSVTILKWHWMLPCVHYMQISADLTRCLTAADWLSFRKEQTCKI